MEVKIYTITLFILSVFTTVALSDDVCLKYDNCHDCISDNACGWCDSTETCMSGTNQGATPPGVCLAGWFYHSCNTMEGSNCSANIAIISCARYCNINGETYDPEMCLECHDLSRCYNDDTCKTWDESMCPDGVIHPDYDDPKRVDHTVLSNNMRMIDPSVIIYKCPYRLRDDDDEATMFVSKSDLNCAVNDVIYSEQSDGILHKIENYTRLEGISIFTGTPVSLEDIIEFADFQQTAEIAELMDPQSVEQLPDPLLLEELSADELNLTIPVYDLEPITELYKCAGQLHGDFYSYFIVLPIVDLPPGLSVGDIIISNRSDGYLETVKDVCNTTSGWILETSLTKCASSKIPNLIINLDIKPDMCCYGGYGWPGMCFVKNCTSELTNRTFAGRPSGPFVGHVLDITVDIASGYVFIEVANIEDIENNVVFTSGITPARKKRALLARFTRSLRRTRMLNVESASVMQTHFEENLAIDITVRRRRDIYGYLTLDYRVCFRGDISFYTRITGWMQAEIARAGQIELVNSMLAVFAIRIPGIGRLWGFVQCRVLLDWHFSATGVVHFEIVRSATTSFKVGISTGTIPAIVQETSGSLTESVSAIVTDYKFECWIKLTKLLIIQWPAQRIIFRRIIYVPRYIIDWTGMYLVLVPRVQYFKIAIIRFELEIPYFLLIQACGCSKQCPDPAKQLRIDIFFGIPFILRRLTVCEFPVLNDILIPVPPMIGHIGFCTDQPWDCCICDETGKHGLYDPITKICYCRCCCNPPGIDPESPKCLVHSVTDLVTGKCKCDLCPDGTPRRLFYPECPCWCNDGTLREMAEDGTCPCFCYCEDKSQHYLDSFGNCPCYCWCKDCTTSTILPSGECDCDDECDISCIDGRDPIWVGCRCKCRDPPCGVPPLCTEHRTGPFCDDPFCPDCEDEDDYYCRKEPMCEAECVEIPDCICRVHGDPIVELCDFQLVFLQHPGYFELASQATGVTHGGCIHAFGVWINVQMVGDQLLPIELIVLSTTGDVKVDQNNDVYIDGVLTNVDPPGEDIGPFHIEKNLVTGYTAVTVAGCTVSSFHFDNPSSKALIQIDSDLSGDLQGLCGDYDGVQDDLRLQDGTPSTDQNAISASWVMGATTDP